MIDISYREAKMNEKSTTTGDLDFYLEIEQGTRIFKLLIDLYTNERDLNELSALLMRCLGRKNTQQDITENIALDLPTSETWQASTVEEYPNPSFAQFTI